MDFINLQKFGFDNFFENSIRENYCDLDLKNSFAIARVTSRNKNYYGVLNHAFSGIAELTGKLLYSAKEQTKLPVTGDWVIIQPYEPDKAFIHNVLPRKNALKRKTPGKKFDIQIIASNIDTALILQSLETKINSGLIERYLSSIVQQGIKPMLLLSKSDLLSSKQIFEIIEKIKFSGVKINHIIPYSALNNHNIDKITNLLNPVKTHCFLGKSGSGKSTLINTLFGENKIKTNEVRKNDYKGKHTTTASTLFLLQNGAIAIDTPGIREFSVIDSENGINQTFETINNISKNCKFKDCTHIHEKGCAVLLALENKEIEKEQYNNYLKLQKENKYNEMSHFEKRKKDKAQGKFYKQVMKHKNKRKSV